MKWLVRDQGQKSKMTAPLRSGHLEWLAGSCSHCQYRTPLQLKHCSSAIQSSRKIMMEGSRFSYLERAVHLSTTSKRSTPMQTTASWLLESKKDFSSIRTRYNNRGNEFRTEFDSDYIQEGRRHCKYLSASSLSLCIYLATVSSCKSRQSRTRKIDYFVASLASYDQ